MNNIPHSKTLFLELLIKNQGWRASCMWTANFKQLQEVLSQVLDNFWKLEAL